MGLASPYLFSRSSAKPVNLEHFLIIPRPRVDIVPVAPSRKSKASPHAFPAQRDSSPSEDRHRAVFAALAPTPIMRNPERAKSAPQGSTQGLQGPQIAVLFPTALQEPGLRPGNLSWIPAASLIQLTTTRQSKKII
jgi:hypothetical protein